jgi:hypothetical protein
MTTSPCIGPGLVARLAWPLTCVSCLVLAVACASVPPPNAQLAVSQAALDRASAEAGADAPAELAAARDKLGRAHVAYMAQDYGLANRLADEAEADASLAEAQARSARSTRALTEVRQGITQLQDEMKRR